VVTAVPGSRGDADADADGQPLQTAADVGRCLREHALDGLSSLVERSKAAPDEFQEQRLLGPEHPEH
jgi:hypothetical protein